MNNRSATITVRVDLLHASIHIIIQLSQKLPKVSKKKIIVIFLKSTKLMIHSSENIVTSLWQHQAEIHEAYQTLSVCV